MTSNRVTVRIPATTANLGPGFDCLALTLDLWNETTISLEGSGIQVEVRGEGQASLPRDGRNLMARAMQAFYAYQGAAFPPGVKISCENNIPLGSGLGSSGAAVLAGLLGANALLGSPASLPEVLELAVKMEGHADNAAAALYGGLVVVVRSEGGWIIQRYDLPPLPVTVVLPAVNLPTRAARAALPKDVPLADAVFNLGRTALVVEALRAGDLLLLGRVMDDRLHQPYRLSLISGAGRALEAARNAGAAAAALSGAGPSVAAFGGDAAVVAEAVIRAFNEASVPSRVFPLRTINAGCEVIA